MISVVNRIASPGLLRRAAAGFTLIEIMVSVAILGLIMVMLASSFHAITAGKVQGEARLLNDRAARAVLWQIGNELRGAIQTPLIPSHVMLLGQAHMESRVPLDELTVSTINLSHRGSIIGFGAEELVSYTTSANPNHPGWFMLERTESSALAANSRYGGPAPMVLATNVIRLHIRYFNGSIWNESWDSTSLPPGASLPEAVSIDLVTAGPHGEPIPLSTQVTLPMAFTQW